MDFIDKQHIVRFKIGQQRRQITRALQDRAGSAFDRHTHFLGDDVGQRGLAQPRRTENQRVVQRFRAPARSLDKQLHLFAHGWLTNIVGQAQRTNRPVLNFFPVPPA